jgi:hypothetical protein
MMILCKNMSTHVLVSTLDGRGELRGAEVALESRRLDDMRWSWGDGLGKYT